MGGVGNGVTEADPHWDLNPSEATMWGLTTYFGEWRGGSPGHVVQEAGKQGAAAMQSSLS